METAELHKLAEQVYDYCCAARSKDGKSPREIGQPYEKLYDSVKEFYCNIVKWHLANKSS